MGEGIVSAIGSATTYSQVLEKPDAISRAVLDKGLDAGTAFEILSIDIADLDVGKTLVLHCRLIRQRLICRLLRQERKPVAPWQ